MQEIIISLISNYGYLAIFILITLENIFPPIPSEVILTFSGFMITKTSLNLTGTLLISTTASTLGALILYYLGKILNEEKIDKIITSKIGKLLGLKPQNIKKAYNWFNKKGQKTVLICRFIPIVRSLISIPAGMVEMNLKKFLIYTVLGTLIWNTVLITSGYLLGNNWERVLQIINSYSHIVILATILIILLIYIRKKQLKKQTNSW